MKKPQQVNDAKQPEETQPENQSPAPDAESKALAQTAVNESGFLTATTLEGRFRIANAFYRAGMVPKSYKDAASVMAGMELAVQLGLPPLSGLRNIAVINGNPSIWGELPLALARQSGTLQDIEEYVFNQDYKRICFDNGNLKDEPYGAVCRVQRKGSSVWHETFFTMDDAKLAGLLGRDNPWKKYPRRMLQMRARSQALKDCCPDALMGIAISEYDFNHIPKDVTPSRINYDGTEYVDPVEKVNAVTE